MPVPCLRPYELPGSERIAIARAVIRNPKVLLLDEVRIVAYPFVSVPLNLSQATSALDSTSERIVQQVNEQNSSLITVIFTLSRRHSTMLRRGAQQSE